MAKARKEVTDEDRELLEELGIESEAAPSGGRSHREQRMIAGFEEIVRFVEEHGRPPGHGEGRDIFERIYAMRLERIRNSAECRVLVADSDRHGLLKYSPDTMPARVEETAEDDALLAALGVAPASGEDIAKLVHVRPRDEIKAAEEVAQRTPCADFEKFKPLFDRVQQELAQGVRQTLPYKDNMEVRLADLFILDGQKIYIAELGEEIVTGYDGRPNRRLRAVYDNGTENNILLRSFQRSLHKDKASRRIIESDLGPLFSDRESEEDLLTDYIYVLRSKSEHPFVAQHRELIHKIGVTGGDVKSRISNAEKDATYLLAEVEIVATYKLAGINRTKLENLLHRIFAPALLDLTIQDRFGHPVRPREWFLVPLQVIDEAVKCIRDGSITHVAYDPNAARLVSRIQ